MSKITIQVSKCESNQVWTSDPDMIEVTVSESFLKLAQTCIDFMQKNEVNYMCQWYTLGYKFFTESDSGHNEGDVLGEDQRCVEGQIYDSFDPEYSVDGCHAIVYADGDIKALFPFKHSNEQLECKVGNIVDLHLKMREATECEPA